MADYRVPPLNLGERLYRLLLHLYPPHFRRAFDRDLIEAFRDQRRDASRRRVPAAAFAILVAYDLFTQALAERASSMWSARRRRNALDREEPLMTGSQRALDFGELRQAARRLVRAPSFSVTTVFVLALGVGATTAVFSVVNGVLLRPLPYAEPGRLVALTHSIEVSGVPQADQSEGTVLFYQEHAKAFTGIGAWRDQDVNLELVDGHTGAPERVGAAQVTSNLFGVLGIPPLLGRDFKTGEDRVGASPVVMLSYRFWQRHFSGDRSAIGKRIVTDGVSREIVGVMPKEFVFPRSTPELWFPLPLDPAKASVASFNYRGIGRLRNDATLASAKADLARVLPGLLDEFPGGIPRAMWEQAHVRPQVAPLLDSIVGDVSSLLWILLGSVGLVLLIACANVANLFLVRGEARQLELAVRGALGSGVAGIIAQCLSESLVLAAAGGLVGVLFAIVGVSWAAGWADKMNVPRLEQVSIDGRVLAFALGVCAVSTLLVSLIPLLRASRVPIAMVLRESGRGSTVGAERQRTRSALVVAQVALALVLVTGAGLLARSFTRLRNVQPGFDGRDVSMTRMALSRTTYPKGPDRVRFFGRLLDQVRALPGVKEATISDWVPLTSDHNDVVVDVEDHPLPPGALPADHFVATVDPDFFKTLGIPLLAGQTLESPYRGQSSMNVVVSKAFAERYWPGGSALGKHIRPALDGPWFTVVGVVGNVHFEALNKPPEDAMYAPLLQTDTSAVNTPLFVALLVRTEGHQDVALPVRNIVHTLDPALPTYDQRSIASVIAAASSRARVTVLLLVIASTLALILGAVGLYGVLAYGVSLRQREIGVRIVLGARPSEVSWMVSRQALGLALAGIVVGTGFALAATRLLRGLLYDVSPTDPLTLGATCLGLLAMAGMASWIPARRAAAVDPSEALRSA
ncbi:MAG: ABC transporter permease [Gemmatimonas sp.]|nr:ABC transporter permease [Gemmatimonadaceae bacterium]